LTYCLVHTQDDIDQTIAAGSEALKLLKA